MKENCCLLALLILGSPLALGQNAPPPVDLAEPSSFATKGACLSECERVLADCEAQCEDTSARADVRHFDTPDLPVGKCIDACQVDLRLCNEDC